jgi:hypothetical protein
VFWILQDVSSVPNRGHSITDLRTLYASSPAQVAEVALAWLQDIVPPDWFDRYSRRVEDARLSQAEDESCAYS